MTFRLLLFGAVVLMLLIFQYLCSYLERDGSGLSEKEMPTGINEKFTKTRRAEIDSAEFVPMMASTVFAYIINGRSGLGTGGGTT